MVNFTKNEKILSPMHRRIIRYSIWVGCLVLVIWIINQNFALTGNYKVSINSFLRLPRSIQYVGGAEVGVVATPYGPVTRPYTDQLKFAVTLPRGFDTMTMTAEVDADPYATLVLSAKTSPTASQAGAFRMPTAFGSDWRSTTLDGGRLQLKDHENIQNAEAFWTAFKTFRRVYMAGGDLASAIPTALYAKDVQLGDIRLEADYRGLLTVSAYLDSGTKDIRFTKKDLNYTPGADTLRFTLERGGKIVASQNVGDDTGIGQDIVVNLPELAGGFYTLRFAPNNKDSLVRNVQFRGLEALLDGRIFLGPVPDPVTFYTTCKTFTATAVHDLGLKSSLTINGRKVKLKAIKAEQEVSFNGDIGTIIIPRGDISLTNGCGFYLKPDHPIRYALEKLTSRIVPLPEFTSVALSDVDVVFDDTPLAQIKTKTGYIIEKKFDLHKLSAKGKTFTFSLENPGLTTRTGAYLHIKSITFTAHRPPFSLRDLRKVF